MENKPKTLDRPEMVAILEDIARNGQNAAARIAAIKQLDEWHSGDRPSAGFDELDELAKRRSA